ncbi:UDP-2,3-diacylglucosamine diphosphatase [Marinifilum caeruleilacunae]|uniref:UDP-2,3-diacylglucosamine diphosphatase n=1 Tax=Marinifilum caeruleilacunae TaxID=2499076 RepID=A0ABX1WS11_9BACT|nr:UDP-2,3-diacylglucosamine diphosphatase [Marinifilum caeruleilacunae]NOU58836.1 UDP-2,3-diacylglucosamine diphosphatase [Marinifilum caeruleilacunae]
MSENKKIYFASDVHLGAPALNNNRERELLFVKWLDMAKKDAEAIYLMGDIFDFWFEYKRAVPRGFTRVLGKLAEITDSGIPVHFFTGNHDIWVFDYLPSEIGVIVHRDIVKTQLQGKKFFLGHGDGLGPYDKGYKFLKSIFTNKFLQWSFARIHPNFAIWLAHKWSGHSRLSNGMIEAENFRGVDKEWLVLFAKDELKKEHFDYFVFGHRHWPCDIDLNGKSRYINTGDWVTNFTYAVLDNGMMELKEFEKPKAK